MDTEEKTNMSASEAPAQGNPSFLDRLSMRGKEVLDSRAKTKYVGTRTAAEQAVSAAYTKVLTTEAKIAEHNDVSIKNMHDLTPGSNSDPAVWVNQALDLQKELYYARLSYSIAKQWFDEQFPARDNVSLPEVKTIQGI